MAGYAAGCTRSAWVAVERHVNIVRVTRRRKDGRDETGETGPRVGAPASRTVDHRGGVLSFV